jgi:predicted nucleic acid-binding protein
VSEIHRRGVSGGAVYDALIALTAAEHEAELLSLDGRAEATYRRCGANYRLLG